MEVKTFNGPQIIPQRRDEVHHRRDSADVIIGRAKKLNQALERVLPEHPSTAAEMARQLGEPRVRSREDVPHLGKRNADVEKIPQGQLGLRLGLGGRAVEAVGDVAGAAIGGVPEGDEVGPDDSGVLERAGLSPAESLAGGEGEREGKLRFGEVEWDPLGGGGGVGPDDLWG